MPTMTKRERRAATKFLARMRKPAPPPVDTPYAKATERWRKQGYRDAPGAPRGTALLATIEQTKRSAREDGVPGNAPTQAQFDEHMGGEFMAPVPDELIAPGSRAHVLAEAGGVVRLYSRSAFDDAVLLVEETEADAFFPREPEPHHRRASGHRFVVAVREWRLDNHRRRLRRAPGASHHRGEEARWRAAGAVRSPRRGHHRGSVSDAMKGTRKPPPGSPPALASAGQGEVRAGFVQSGIQRQRPFQARNRGVGLADRVQGVAAAGV